MENFCGNQRLSTVTNGYQRLGVTCALHAKEQEHGDDGEEGADGVGYDVFQRIVVGYEQDVEHRCGGKIARQEAACVWQNGRRLYYSQTEKCDCPDSMEDLQEKNKEIFDCLDLC